MIQINTQAPIKFKANDYQVNYNNRYTSPVQEDNSLDDVFMMQAMEQQKAEKKEKSKENWNKAGVLAQIGIAVGFLASAAVALAGLCFKKKMYKIGGIGGIGGDGSKKLLDTLKPVDVSKEKSFDELTLSPDMKKVVEDIKTRIERSESLKKKGEKGGLGMMLYGEPGGGKNAFVYANTKYMQEKFPGTELYEMNVLKLTDKYVGETENNIIGFVEQLEKKAKSNPDKKFIVFMDEFDSIARKEDGSDKKLGEKFQNAFKMTLTKLTSCDNIQVIAATNKAAKGVALDKFLDDAILNRFPQKIFIPLPSKEQLKNAIVEYYKKLPKDVVDKELTNIKNSELDSICASIAKKSNHASFRDLQYIFDHARIISEGANRKTGTPITITDLKEAVKKHAENENWSAKGFNPNVNNVSTNNNLGFLQRIKNFFNKS